MDNPIQPLLPFTHRIFVDFSGDDGRPNIEGASSWLTVAWVVSKECDIHHNEGVVLRIKATIGCKHGDELKYRALRRHRYKDECLQLLQELQAKVVLMCVEKRSITEKDISEPATKRLVTILHTLPLHRVLRVLPYKGDSDSDPYFQLVMDEVAWRGSKESIIQSFKEDKGLDWTNAREDWLRFAKSGNDLMIQLADVFAGMAREYMETLPPARPPCRTLCQPHNKVISCQYVRKQQTVGRASLMRHLWPLLACDHIGRVWDTGLIMRPPEVEWSYMFLHCLRPKGQAKG